MRPRLALRPDPGIPLRRPAVEVRRSTVRPAPGAAPLDVLVALPGAATGVLAYFPGFNTPLGEWEVAKCQMLAAISGQAVVVCELPGLSRHGDPIPQPVWRDMVRGRVDTWAELAYAYVEAALRELPGLPVRQALGYSTGCSLVTAALPRLAEAGTLSRLTLVEPVSIARRGLAAVAVHDVADLIRLPAVQATNDAQPWVMDLRPGRLGDRTVHYSAVDLYALTRVLGTDALVDQLVQVDLPAVGLARGQRSSLCPRPAFDLLHDKLERAGVSGVTATVAGLGHQLWHSFPVLTCLASLLLRSGNTLSQPHS